MGGVSTGDVYYSNYQLIRKKRRPKSKWHDCRHPFWRDRILGGGIQTYKPNVTLSICRIQFLDPYSWICLKWCYLLSTMVNHHQTTNLGEYFWNCFQASKSRKSTNFGRSDPYNGQPRPQQKTARDFTVIKQPAHNWRNIGRRRVQAPQLRRIVGVTWSNNWWIHRGKLTFWTQSHGGLEDDFPLQMGDFKFPAVNFQGCTLHKTTQKKKLTWLWTMENPPWFRIENDDFSMSC